MSIPAQFGLRPSPHFGGLSDRAQQRLKYAQMDGTDLILEIGRLDEAIQGRKSGEHVREPIDRNLHDAVDVLIMKLGSLSPFDQTYFANGCKAIEDVKTAFSPELEEKYVTLNARRYL